MNMRRTALILLFALTACETQPDHVHIADASSFTERYAKSRFTDWNIRANAAGTNCEVLLIETSILIDETMVEAVHYDGNDYDVYEGGVQSFYKERGFQGVVYKDPSGQIWTYGNVTMREAEQLEPCG